jgi:hypothetical protein
MPYTSPDTCKLSDIYREPDGRWNGPLIAISALAFLLIIGHFTYPASSIQEANATTTLQSNYASPI